MRSVPETKREASPRGDSPGREADLRDQAAALALEQLEAAAMRAHHALDDGEPQARSSVVAARDLQAREGPLEPLDFGQGDARAAVGHLEHHGVVFGAYRDPDVLLSVPQGVVDEIQNDP